MAVESWQPWGGLGQQWLGVLAACSQLRRRCAAAEAGREARRYPGERSEIQSEKCEVSGAVQALPTRVRLTLPQSRGPWH